MAASNVQKAVAAGGGVGWAGFATMGLQKLDEYLHPTTVQLLADQYTTNLAVIAAKCAPIVEACSR